MREVWKVSVRKTCDALRIDRSFYTYKPKRGEQADLKPKEMELLIYFIRNRGRAFTREQLLREVWGYDFYGDSRTVDVHVSWLRQKIEEQPGKPTRILTVRGVGYRFEA